MSPKGTVLIVDDDPRVLQSLQTLLRIRGYQVQTYIFARAILTASIPTDACCAIIDMQMPGLSGFELHALLLRKRPGTPVIFITGYGDIPKAVQAMKAGAVDFLTKPVEERKLLEAVRRALYQDHQARLEQQALAEFRKRFNTLTPREKDVCTRVAEGKLNKQIAAELGTCEKTVKVHRGRVMKKMRVDSVADLVRIMLRIGSAVASETVHPPPARRFHPPLPSRRPLRYRP